MIISGDVAAYIGSVLVDVCILPFSGVDCNIVLFGVDCSLLPNSVTAPKHVEAILM